MSGDRITKKDVQQAAAVTARQACKIADDIYSGKRPWKGGNVLLQACEEAMNGKRKKK